MPARRRRKLFEDGLILRVGPLRRAGLLKLGATVHRSLRITNAPRTISDVEAVSCLDSEGNGRLAARIFPVSCSTRAPDQPLLAVFEICGRPSPWGRGVFVWFICPVTKRRCRTLYLPEGEIGWACYAQWPKSDYAHAVENLSRFHRVVAKSRRLRERLPGGTDWLDTLPIEALRGCRQRQLAFQIHGVEAGEFQALADLADKAAWARNDRKGRS